jgi:hypothetical protein
MEDDILDMITALKTKSEYSPKTNSKSASSSSSSRDVPTTPITSSKVTEMITPETTTPKKKKNSKTTTDISAEKNKKSKTSEKSPKPSKPSTNKKRKPPMMESPFDALLIKKEFDHDEMSLITMPKALQKKEKKKRKKKEKEDAAPKNKGVEASASTREQSPLPGFYRYNNEDEDKSQKGANSKTSKKLSYKPTYSMHDIIKDTARNSIAEEDQEASTKTDATTTAKYHQPQEDDESTKDTSPTPSTSHHLDNKKDATEESSFSDVNSADKTPEGYEDEPEEESEGRRNNSHARGPLRPHQEEEDLFERTSQGCTFSAPPDTTASETDELEGMNSNSDRRSQIYDPRGGADEERGDGQMVVHEESPPKRPRGRTPRDDDSEEAARRRRAVCFFWMFVCCVVVVIIVGVVLLVVLLTNDDNGNTGETEAPRVIFDDLNSETDDDFFYQDQIIVAPGVRNTEMAMWDLDCDYDDQTGFPNVWDQCECAGQITVVPEDVVQTRDVLIERLLPVFYGNNTYNIGLSSCDPSNMALIWLASGDNRDAGYIRQRYALALTFFLMEGPAWDYMNAWLTPINECLWLGLQCNNWDVVNSFALDTNNVYGTVSVIDSPSWCIVGCSCCMFLLFLSSFFLIC